MKAPNAGLAAERPCMSRWCERCRQVCADTDGPCPRCGAAAVTSGSAADVRPPPSAPRSRLSDSEVDLGGPQGAADDLAGPPSGASFVSWAALFEQQSTCAEDRAAVLGTASSARTLLDQAPTGLGNNGMVDFDKQSSSRFEPPAGARVAFAQDAAGTDGQRAPAARRRFNRAVLLAVALVGVSAALALWSAGALLDRSAPSPDRPASLKSAP